jgi:hypothetical protein
VRPNVVLTVTSLLSMLLFTFHLSDDIVRGFEPGGFKHLSGMLTLILWLYATLVLADRWPRYTIILLASLLTSLMPLAHMRGAGLVGSRVAGSSGMHFWVWTLLAVGVTAGFSAILSARELWRLRGSQPR